MFEGMNMEPLGDVLRFARTKTEDEAMALRCVLFLSLAFAPALASAQNVVVLEGETGEWDDQPPDVEWVWEDGYVRPDGTTVDGFYRESQRDGWSWDGPHWDNDGQTWVEPGWRWTGAAKPGFVVVPGHRAEDGYWVADDWRPQSVPNQDWVDGRWEGNVWIEGSFRPRVARAGFVWEPGHWTPAGAWIDGQWRPAARQGFAWVPAAFRFGRWRPGYWRPLEVQAGQVWVPGYWNGAAWIDGHWRPARRQGFRWVHGYWQGNTWVDGTWVAGVRPPVRRYRIQPVHRMIQTRRAHVRRLRVGVGLEAHGRAVEQRGQVIENRGEVRGNVRMQIRGQRLQNRGQRQQNRGHNIIRRH